MLNGTTLSPEQARHLLDWAGRLCAEGVQLTVRDGRLHIRGAPGLLTPAIMAALRTHEAALVGALTRAETDAIAWRVAAMLDALSRRPDDWRHLKAWPAMA